MRNLNPSKEKAEAKENDKNEGENLLMKKMLTNQLNKIIKPRIQFKTKAAENPDLNSIEKFLTPTRPKSMFMIPKPQWVQIKEMQGN